MKGTLSLSWGKWGGCYRYRARGEHLSTLRICIGWVAVTYIGGIELDDLMEAYACPAPLDPEAELHRRVVVARAMFAPLDSEGYHPSASQVTEAARVIELIEGTGAA